MYWEEVCKRIPEEELELLTREIKMCRDAGGDWGYELSLAEDVAARLYAEIEVQFATYPQSNLFHAFVMNAEGGNVERCHDQSNKSFWWALRYALIGLGAAKIEPDQEW
jgi:hypothetical protein